MFEQIKEGDEVILRSRLFPGKPKKRNVVVSKVTKASIYIENNTSRFRRFDGRLSRSERYNRSGGHNYKILPANKQMPQT